MIKLPANVDALYEIDPAEVAASVARKIEQNERYRRIDRDKYNHPDFKGKPWPGMEAFYDNRNKEERERYATVRIARFVGTGRKRYGLVYAGDFTQATGLFETIQKAALWFIRDGR